MTRAKDIKTLVLGAWSALVALFLLLPIFVVLAYSFNVGDYLIIWKGTGLRWYWRILEDGNILATLKTSFAAALLSTAMSVVLGGISGLVLSRRSALVAYPLGLLLLTVISFPEIVKAVAYLVWYVKIDLRIGLLRIALSHALFGTAIVAFVVRARLAGI